MLLTQWLLSNGPADWALVLLALVTAIAAIRTLNAMKEQLTANVTAANAAAKSADIAEVALKSTERAYVHISTVEFIFGVPNEEPRVILQLVNRGRLPASLTQRSITLQLGHPAHLTALCCIQAGRAARRAPARVVSAPLSTHVQPLQPPASVSF